MHHLSRSAASVEARPKLINSGPLLADVGRNSSEFGRNPAKLGSDTTYTELDRIWGGVD